MANIALTNDTTNNVWTYSPSINKQSGNVLILSTANKFLDKNIKITPTVTTTSRSAGDGILTLTAGNGSATFAVGSGDSASTSNTSLSVSTSTPSSGVYYTITVTGKGNVSGSGSGKVSTGTGWVTSGTTTSNAATSSKDSNTATLYRYIMKSVPGSTVSGSLPSSLTRTSGTYEDIEIQPKGYVKIPAGYNPKDKYVFANIADASGESRAASGYSLSISSVSGDSAISAGTLTSGYYPVTANNLSITGTLSASTAGWFSTGSATDSDTDGVTVGKVAAGVLGASVSSNSGGSASIAATGFTALTGSTTSSYYVTLSTSSGSVKAKASVSTEGYVRAETAETAATSVSVSGNGTKLYIPTNSIAGSVVDLTAPSVAVSGAATGMATSSTATDYYVTVTGTGTNGSVKGKATAGGTTGIVAASASNTSGASTITPGITGSGTKIYIIAGSITNNTTLPSGTTATGTINRGSYIKINKGYYNADKYYLAQGVSGNIQLTQSSSTDISGYATATVRGVTGSIGGSASAGSAAAAIANTNNMENVVTTAPSGTAGTDYWQIKATATGTAGSYTPKYTVSTSGWIGSTVTGTAQTVSVSSDSTGKSLYIKKAAIAGSSTNASATTTVAPGTVSISKQSTPSGVTNAASGNATTTAPSSGVYVAVKATAAANTTGTTSSISGSGSATVSTAGYAPATLTGSVSVSGTATAKTSAKDSAITYVPITTATMPTAVSSTTNSGTLKATVSRSTSDQYINIPVGYNTGAAYYKISAVANGSASTPATTITTNPTITVSSSGLITASYSGSKSVTPTVSAGYVSSGTAGTISTTGSATSQLTTKGATTITPSSTTQIAVSAGTYVTGAITVAAIPLAAGNSF